MRMLAATAEWHVFAFAFLVLCGHTVFAGECCYLAERTDEELTCLDQPFGPTQYQDCAALGYTGGVFIPAPFGCNVNNLCTFEVVTNWWLLALPPPTEHLAGHRNCLADVWTVVLDRINRPPSGDAIYDEIELTELVLLDSEHVELVADDIVFGQTCEIFSFGNFPEILADSVYSNNVGVMRVTKNVSCALSFVFHEPVLPSSLRIGVGTSSRGPLDLRLYTGFENGTRRNVNFTQYWPRLGEIPPAAVGNNVSELSPLCYEHTEDVPNPIARPGARSYFPCTLHVFVTDERGVPEDEEHACFHSNGICCTVYDPLSIEMQCVNSMPSSQDCARAGIYGGYFFNEPDTMCGVTGICTDNTHAYHMQYLFSEPPDYTPPVACASHVWRVVFRWGMFHEWQPYTALTELALLDSRFRVLNATHFLVGETCTDEGLSGGLPYEFDMPSALWDGVTGVYDGALHFLGNVSCTFTFVFTGAPAQPAYLRVGVTNGPFYPKSVELHGSYANGTGGTRFYQYWETIMNGSYNASEPYPQGCYEQQVYREDELLPFRAFSPCTVRLYATDPSGLPLADQTEACISVSSTHSPPASISASPSGIASSSPSPSAKAANMSMNATETVTPSTSPTAPRVTAVQTVSLWHSLRGFVLLLVLAQVALCCCCIKRHRCCCRCRHHCCGRATAPGGTCEPQCPYARLYCEAHCPRSSTGGDNCYAFRSFSPSQHCALCKLRPMPLA